MGTVASDHGASTQQKRCDSWKRLMSAADEGIWYVEGKYPGSILGAVYYFGVMLEATE